jgi:hypothetical protein
LLLFAIKNIDYFSLQFNDNGRIDKKEWEKELRLGMELLPSLRDEQYPHQVIDAQHRFAKRRYEHEFKWKPSRKVEAGGIEHPASHVTIQYLI